MSDRQEFSKRVKLAAWDRCAGHCENCTAKLYPGKFTYDHRIPDWMGGDPTLENCQVICSACDKPKTARDQGDIARAKRIRERRAGVRKPSRFACSRDSGWRKKLNGEVVPR